LGEPVEQALEGALFFFGRLARHIEQLEVLVAPLLLRVVGRDVERGRERGPLRVAEQERDAVVNLPEIRVAEAVSDEEERLVEEQALEEERNGGADAEEVVVVVA